MKKVVVFSETYSANVGDGIIFECLRKELIKRDLMVMPADLSLRKGYAEATSSTHDPGHYPGRRFLRFLVRRSLWLRRVINLGKWCFGGRYSFIRQYKESIGVSDAIIIGGGQLLVDRQLSFPLRILAIVEMAKVAGKPIAVFACGADVKQGLIARHIYRRLLRDAIYVSVRDSQSAMALRRLDLNATVHVHPDIAFLSGCAYTCDDKSPTKILGINVMPYETTAAFSRGLQSITRDDYKACWAALVSLAVAHGWHVRVMTNGDYNDAVIAREIYMRFQDDCRVRLEPPPSTPAMLIGNISKVDVLIASRMHAGIVAYSLGKRVVPLVWDQKVRAVWGEVDPQIRLFDFDECFKDDASLAVIMSCALSDENQCGETVVKEHKAIKEKIERHLDELAWCLNGK